MIDEIEQVAIRTTNPVLISGPTGAGKSLLARRIFELKKRRHQMEGDFIEINCATLRGDTAMSTLFGHKRGAYAGATKDRSGLLRKAHKGLVFLDEIEHQFNQRGYTVKRYQKLTYAHPASIELQQQIATECDVVLEALAD